MFTRAAALMIDEGQKQQLESWARTGTTPQRVARKCRVILLASQGVSNHAIARRLRGPPPTPEAPEVGSGAGLGVGTEDSGYHAEGATARRHPLECTRTGSALAGFAHEGASGLAAV